MSHVPDALSHSTDGLLQALANSIPDPVFAKDREGRYVLLNQTAAAILGRPIASVIGLDDRSLFPPEVATALMANDRTALEIGRTEQYQEVVMSNGVTRTHLVTKSPYFDRTGRVAGLVCSAKDIDNASAIREGNAARLTGIIRMQEAIADPALGADQVMVRMAERVMELLGADGAIIYLEENGLLACHAACGRMTQVAGGTLEISTTFSGRAFSESVALRCRDAQTDPRVMDTSLYRELGMRSALAVPLRGGLQTIGVLTVGHTQPDRFPEEIFQALILIGGVLSAALARSEVFSRNRRLLSERTATLEALSASEERFRSAIHAAGLGVWDWHVASNTVAWLGHHEEIFGLVPGTFDGRFATFLGAVHPEDREGVQQAITGALKSRTEYAHLHRVVWPDGSVHWILGRGEFQYDPQGHAIRMIGAVMDVTDRRNLESQLLQAQKIEAVGHLAAGVAHEINTPIQYVADNLRFLEEGFGHLLEVVQVYRGLALPEAERAPARDAWARIDGDYLVEQIPLAARQALDGAERVAEIVRAMKEFSHPGSAEMSPADLNHAITNTVAVSRNEWRYCAELELALDPHLPQVTCLLGEMQQVILNLIVNAAHAIADAQRAEKGRIVVRTRRVGEQVEIAVEDSGTGIPEAFQARVFDPFFTTKEVGRGTGQGLALAYDTVVKKHGGTLTFTTDTGIGTTFVVRIPVAPAGAVMAGVGG